MPPVPNKNEKGAVSRPPFPAGELVRSNVRCSLRVLLRAIRFADQGDCIISPDATPARVGAGPGTGSLL